MVKVSVVVPVYNPGKYFEACIKSLLGQTLPAAELELIFVDDGSTDETPALLDTFADEHPQVQVIHQENSGWPGQPRNVGIAAAQGEYIFFCDHDDWMAPEALERLYDFAVACHSDVVLPRMAGIGRPVPYHVFRETRSVCNLADAPIMDSLTPHKLFRRAFLDDHELRFPEGKRRLEDHLFVSTAYLLAEVVSIYADYTCYFHLKLDDASNAGFRRIEWPGYFANLTEALDGVEARVEPGELRDRIFRRWLQVEMVGRLSGGRRVRMADAEADALLAAAQPVAERYFGDGVVSLLTPLSQKVARAIIAGDGEEILRIATAVAAWRVEPRLLQVGWSAGRLQIAGTADLTDTDTGESRLTGAVTGEATHTDTDNNHNDNDTDTRPADGELTESVAAATPEDPEGLVPQHFPTDLSRESRLAGLVGSLDDESKPSFGLDLTERRTGARWFVPATVHQIGLHAAFTADLDPDTLAAGQRLPNGLWDVYLSMAVLGLYDRRRLTLVSERQTGEVLPEPVEEGLPTWAAYFTAQTSALALDIGLRKHKELRQPPPEPEPEVVTVEPDPASLTRRGVRRLRRMISG